MGLDRLNQIANARFNELKAKQGIQNVLKRDYEKEAEIDSTKTPDENKFHEMFTKAVAEKKEEFVRETDFIDKIDALGLSPELSLAVSFIVIAHHEPDKKVQSIKRAVMTLEDEIN